MSSEILGPDGYPYMPKGLSGPDKEKHIKIVEDAISKLSFAKTPSPTPISDIFGQMTLHVEAVKRQVWPILQAGGGAKKEDRESKMRPMVYSEMLNRVNTFSKDELVMITTLMVSQFIMQDIEDDPWGTGSPSLISSS